MRIRIDAARQTGDDDDVLRGKPLRQLASEAAGRRRGIARADDGDRPPRTKSAIAPCDQGDRSAFRFGQQRRIIGIAQEDVARAEPLDLLGLGSHFPGIGGPEALRTASRRQIRQRLERRAGAAEARDQLAIGHRPDIGRADEPQTIEPVDPGLAHAQRLILRRTLRWRISGRRAAPLP